MTRQFRLTITGDPIAKGRPFVTKQGVAFTPAKTRKWENDARQVARSQIGDEKPLTGPINLRAGFYFRIPASWPKWQQACALQQAFPHTKKPDVDNVLKAVKDAMNGILWLDDSQVVRIAIGKFYDDRPRIEIEVTEQPTITKETWEASQCPS